MKRKESGRREVKVCLSLGPVEVCLEERERYRERHKAVEERTLQVEHRSDLASDASILVAELADGGLPKGGEVPQVRDDQSRWVRCSISCTLRRSFVVESRRTRSK